MKYILILIQAKFSCKWVDDSQSFLLEHFDAIKDSPFHIYQSALPLCPTSSWLYEHHSVKLSQGVKVVKGQAEKWGKCFRTVPLSSTPRALACWKALIAVGFGSSDDQHHSRIVILDAITGAHLSIISGDVGWVSSLTFSPDGTSLVSGGLSGVVKLWDVQTGGIVKTFHGHTKNVTSVSVSLDCARIASGSWDNTIRLWDMQAGECYCVIDRHSDFVHSVSFSPMDSQLLISASRDNTILWWDVNGCQVGPTYEGHNVVFSSDGAYFVSYVESVAIVRTSNSGAVIAELWVPSDVFECCSFSLDGKFLAGAAGNTIYIWDITGSDPCLVETLVGHTKLIVSLAFSPSLISLSWDRSVKFWQSSASLMASVATVSGSTPLSSASILGITLQTNESTAISHDSAGVVKCWDVTTSLCKATFQAPVLNSTLGDFWGDMRLINDRLIFVWYSDPNVHIWDTEKVGPPLVIDAPSEFRDTSPVISGDGSKVFLLIDKFIRAWSVRTGELVGEVELEDEVELADGVGSRRGSITGYFVHGQRVWVDFGGTKTQGWDFGTPGSAPIPLYNVAPESPDLVLRGKEGKANHRIEDKVTGVEVFQLSGRYTHPTDVQWDGRYLVAGYGSGEVLILDFINMLPQGYVVFWPSPNRSYVVKFQQPRKLRLYTSFRY